MIILSKYYSPRADRISKMLGSRLSFTFAIKCNIKKQPLKVIITLTSVVTLILGLCIYIIESPVQTTYARLKSCFWNILITITTVGYGDYHADSTLGRFIIVVAALFGTIIFSITSMFIRHELQLSQPELKVKIANFRYISLSIEFKISIF
jgi:potassium intermediate/small conductance calcium-activated channel subfamily N protein 2